LLTRNLYFHIIGNMKTKDVVAALAALAQESRLAIYRLLVQGGPQGMAAGAIAEELGLPPATLSFHLKELSRAGLVASRQEGRFVIYSANFDAMVKLVGFLTENCCGGNCAPECQPRTKRKEGAMQ
jgi:ArsR family transcriptional regulator, arsenate/arsenite/antimonite-responsive transcriptional repressor